MKRLLPYLILLLAALVVARALRPPAQESPDFALFGTLPVLEGGRVKPLDSVARNSLLIIRGKQQVWIPDANPPPPSGIAKALDVVGFKMPAGRMLRADHWLADVLFKPEAADAHPVFAIANPELLGMLGWPQLAKRHCSYAELKPHLPKIQQERAAVDTQDASSRTPFQAAIVALYNSLVLYQQLKNSVHDEGTADFAKEIRDHAALAAAAKAAAGPGAEPMPTADRSRLTRGINRYERQVSFARLHMVAPPAGATKDDWAVTGTALLRASDPAAIPAPLLAWAEIGDAHRAGDAAAFDRATRAYADWVAAEHPEWGTKTAFEMRFNRMEPFYVGMMLYVGAFMLAVLSWVLLPKELRLAAFLVLLLAFAVHSAGLVARMWLQGRPPVTNLYSSAILVGWGAVFLAIFMEWFYRYGVALATAALVGFGSLIVAHHLGSSGDTMEMMQAVLDSNFWLATHVVVITLGYSAMFLAGALGLAYVLLGVFTRKLTAELAATLSGMVYGVICFATLFSFAGTVLGGIWADQSWGRFWGWDPKENGALLIVLWCAMILHARWGGYIRRRGLMVMAIFGNAITAFSWFGVNMLGVGLHSYGFMEKAFPWLIAFIVSQFLVMALAAVPVEKWRSAAGKAHA
ncbi:MAG: cytochrome c biogenesis protein CcsA [Akkermansiaceae bacterium]|jgi:ABC-type transport system involved in cytochrome c biogenesis permease subunit|nr:cytochrome c biogenesis protein CcsA [Akkermansiaceae bacterium]